MWYVSPVITRAFIHTLNLLLAAVSKHKKKTDSIKIHPPKGQYMHVMYLMHNSASDLGGMNIYQDMYDIFYQAPPINVIEPVSPYACHALLLIIDQETVSTSSKTTLNETTGNYDG